MHDPMAKVCHSCGKGPAFGQSRSHSMVATKRRFDPNLLTEVEVRFRPADARSTRVELEHRLLENMGAAAEAARASFESEQGWSGVLASYAAAAAD